MLAISRTPAFRRFQATVGNATFHINTTVVGLELVASGGTKPPGLNISWTPPKEPRHSVEQTKQFILLAALAHVVDSFDVLLRSYADLTWLGIEPHTKEILRKSVTKSGSKDYSLPERAGALVLYLKMEQQVTLPLLALAVAWRNSLVHVGRAKPRLPEGADCLKTEALRLEARYGIDIMRMLGAFSEGHRPTLKEATTMIAASQNLARAVDQALIHHVAGQADQVSTLVRNELAKAFSDKPLLWKRVWGRDTAARMRALLNFLAELGITETNTPVSAALGWDEAQKIVSSTRSELAAGRLACRD